MAKGVTSKSRNKDEENKRREEQQKPHSEQKQTTQKQKPGQSKPQNETPATSRPATQEVTPKPTSTQIPTLEPKYASPEQIEEARDYGRRSLEMARAGQLDLSEKIPFTQGVEGYAEQYRIPELEETPSTTMPSDNYAAETRQDRTGKGHRPSPEDVSDYNKNPYKSEQRGAQSSEGPVDILGTRKPNSISEEGQRQVDKLSRRIASLQNTPMTGDAAIDEVTQRNNEREIANLQRQISAIYDNDQADDTSNIERYLDPNYRMTKYEENNAERIFDEYLENNPKAKELYNTTDAAMSSLLAQRMSPEEADEYARMVALKNKTSELGSAGLHMVESMPFVKGLADKSAKAYDKMKGTDTSEYNYSNQLEQTQTQNPLAAIGGNMAYQLGQYAAFAPLIEEIPAVGKLASGIGSKFSNPAVAKAVENIIAGQAADTFLDTLPNEIIPDLMEGNWRDLPKDIAINQGENLAFNMFGEGVGALAKNFIPSLRNADEVADAVKQSEIEAQIAPTDEVAEGTITRNADQLTDDITMARHQNALGVPGTKFNQLEENDAVSALNKRGRITEILNQNPRISRYSDAPRKSVETVDAELSNIRNQMDRYARGGFERQEHFDCGSTPQILKEYGIRGDKIMMSQNIYDKITLPIRYRSDGHGLDREGVEQIIKGLDDPAVIMRADNGDGVSVVINYTDKNGDVVFVPLTLGKNGEITALTDIESAAKIKSAHIRPRLDNYLAKRADQIMYIKGEDIPKNGLAHKSATALDTSSLTDSLSDLNINQIDSSVKGAIQPEMANPELEREAEAFFSDMGEGYDGTRDWWKNTIDRAKEFAYNGDPADAAARAEIADRYLGQMEQLERESQALIDAGGTPTWTMPSPTKQLDGVAAKINDVLDNVSLEDETIALEAGNIRKAIDNYRTALNGDSLDAINRARLDLINAAKRFDGRAKKINLDGYDGSFGKRRFTYDIPETMGAGSPQRLWKNIADAEENNRRLLSGEEPEDTLGKLLNGETLEETTKAVPEVKAETPKTEPIPTESAKGTTDVDEPIDLTRDPSGNLKERGTSEHIRSIEDVRVATPMKMEGVSDEVVADFVDNPDMYKVLKNADTKALADDIYNSGDQAVRIGNNVYTGDVETKFGKLLSEKNPAALPLGHQLAKDYSEAGNHDMAAQIYRRMGEELTKAGQFSQAAAINMMKNDPLTALQYAEKQLDAINQQGAKRFGDKWKTLSLTDDEIQAFNSIAPGNADAIKALFDKIGARLGKEYPTTFMEKVLEGRKVAMLFNVRTNVRNVGANVPTLGLRWVSDRVAALGEGAAHLINPDFARTQALTGSGIRGRKIASEIYNSPQVKALIEGTSGKYEVPELQNSLMKDRQMFKGTPVSKWINRVTNGGIEKVNKRLFGKEGVESGLETIRNATYKMLDLGDSPFVRENFIERLGSYINAQKIKDVSQVPDEAIQTAWEEAMKATYKDNSWAVKMLSGIKGGIEQIPGIGKPLSQAVIPFLQAPGNIAARMVDYSPIKATTGVYHILSGAANKSEQAVRKGIDEAAKGLTGSGLIILGMKLREAGLLTGDYSEDKDQKNFEKQNGFIPWSLHIGDKYFQYDWAQPFAEPLIVGSLLQEAIDNSDQYDNDILNHFGIEGSAAGTAIGLAKEGARASVNSWFNASPLQGLAELMSGGYNGTDIAQNVFDAGVSDFAGAFVPSLVNAIAKTEDTTQRQTYDPSSKFNTFLNQQQAKIPGLSEELPIKYDTWGEEMKYANSKPEAFAQRFAIPGNYGTDTNDPIDMEINNLFDATQDAKVFPWTAANKVGDRQLNNREISNYQRDMGQRSRQVVEGFINSDIYKTMDNDEKVNALNEIYNISKTITERDMFGKPVADNSQYKKAIEAYDEGSIDGILDYIYAKNNPYGLDTKEYQEMLNNNEDLSKYEGYKEAQAQFGIDDNKAYREAYANGGIDALGQEVEYQSALEELGLSNSKENRGVWDAALHASADPMAALQKVAENRQAALDAGFTKADGTANQAAYDRAVTVLGNNDASLAQFATIQTDLNDKGYTKQADYVPYLMNQNYSDTQKGQYMMLMAGDTPDDISGKGAAAAFDEYGYDGYYYYRVLQNAVKDYNGDGKVNKYDRIQKLYEDGYNNKSDYFNLFTSLSY